jgi:hypothetical protein
MNAAERAKITSGGTYPAAAAATAVTGIPNLLMELGGLSNSRDVAAWTYSCPAGSNRTLTLVTTSFPDPTIATIAGTKIVANKAPWTAVVAGSVVTVTLPNIVCF